MEMVTIIGAGTGGVKLIEDLRLLSIDCPVQLVSSNKFFISRKSIIDSPANISTRLDLVEWAQDKKVEFIQSRVERVSAKRCKIYCKTGETLGFEKLVVASGLCSNKLPVKGDHREGFFYFSDIDPFLVRDLIKISNEAVVYISTWLGIQYAVALAKLNIEVLAVSASFDFLGSRKNNVLAYLKNKNISLYEGYTIEEAVGEANVKAVKLSPLKVVSAQLVFIDSGFAPCTDFFEEEVLPRDSFFSNFENIYFLGDVSEKNIENDSCFLYNHHITISKAKALAGFLTKGVMPDLTLPLENNEDKEKYFASMMCDIPQEVRVGESVGGETEKA